MAAGLWQEGWRIPGRPHEVLGGAEAPERPGKLLSTTPALQQTWNHSQSTRVCPSSLPMGHFSKSLGDLPAPCVKIWDQGATNVTLELPAPAICSALEQQRVCNLGLQVGTQNQIAPRQTNLFATCPAMIVAGREGRDESQQMAPSLVLDSPRIAKPGCVTTSRSPNEFFPKR